MELLLSVGEKLFSDLGSLHPMLVHFPLALFFIAPLFIMSGLIFKRSMPQFFVSAALLMAIATACIFITVESGKKASEKITEPTMETMSTLSHHYQYGEKSRNLLSLLTIIFIGWAAATHLNSHLRLMKIQIPVIIIFLTVNMWCLFILLKTADAGGKLVHHHHIHTDFYEE